MSKALIPTIRTNALTVTHAVTSYYYCANTLQSSGTDDGVTRIPWRTAGTFSKLFIIVATNTIVGSSTFRLRVDGANVNSVVTITSLTTGTFEDATNTDTITAGQKVNYQAIGGAAGTSLTFSVSGILFDAASSTILAKYVGNTGYIITSDEANYYMGIPSIAGNNASASGDDTDTSSQFKFKTAATLKNGAVYVSANARTSSTLIYSRINGANGNILLTIPATTTGLFEDTTHSDAISTNDLVNCLLVSGTGSGESLTVSWFGYEATATNKAHFLVSTSQLTNNINKSLTRFPALAGNVITAATESLVACLARTTMKLSNLECYVYVNTITASSTIRSRKNSADGNQLITIPASTSGYFEDSTNTDSIVATDKINFEIITGGTGTAMALNNVGVLADYSTTTIKNINGVLYASIKNIDGVAIASVKNVNGVT